MIRSRADCLRMASSKPQFPSEPLCLVFGDEAFLVRDRAGQVYDGWCADAGGEDHEIIDGVVRNAVEASDALARLNEAVQTLPFFGGSKVVWLRDANFLGDDRTASSRDVTDQLNGLAKGWETFDWQGVRVLVSAGKVDKRKTFFKTTKKIGTVEDLSVADKERGNRAALIVRQRLAELGKKIEANVVDELVLLSGTNLQQLHIESEKLSVYVGEREEVTRQDVHAIATRTKQSKAFALADAFGERNLPRLLRVLDEELWEVRLDAKKSPIALLYGLISKVRTMIFLREMLRLKWIRPGAAYPQFKSQLEAIPDERLPVDRKFNPKAMHPYMLFNALGHARRYTVEELAEAMEILLHCNRQLVSSGTDDTLLIQQALVRIVSKKV